MNRLPILLIVLCLGCQQPKPTPEPTPEPAEPAKPAINDLARIDEMAMAADGKEFIAHPPTCYYDHTAALVSHEAIKQQYRDQLVAWAENAKENGKLSEADYQAHIDKWANMSKIELRKEWQSVEPPTTEEITAK